MTRLSFRFRWESQILDEQARSFAPGKFVELPDGIVHYEMAGPPDGQTVILVPGFSVPYYIWDPTFDALVEAGFRVLRYDLYGRGYSDRPDTVYNPELFDRQLLGLLSALNIDQPADLIGLSMGGPIVVLFTDQHPNMVRKLVLVDPAGFPPKLSLSASLLKAPLLGEYLMSLFGKRVLVSQLAAKYRPQTKYRGFRRALLSTLRNGMLGDMTETYERVGKQRRSTMLIWGRHDRTIPFETHEKVRKAIPHIEFHAIDEAGHIPHYESPERVNPILIAFLRR